MESIILLLIGISFGLAVSIGIFAFITSIGIVQRLACRTHTSIYLKVFENAIIYGAVIFNTIFIFQIKIPFNSILITIWSFFSGLYVATLAMSIAEVLKAYPIMLNRIKLKYGLPYIIFLSGIGKALGSYISLCYK